MSQFYLPNANHNILEDDSSERLYKLHCGRHCGAVDRHVTHAYAVIMLTPHPRSMFTRLLGQLLPPLRLTYAYVIYASRNDSG